MKESSTLALTHYGRRSGKAYAVTLWYAVIDGHLWLGSLDATRSWVRNLEAGGRATVDWGEGPCPCRFRRVLEAAEQERFERAILAKYPLRARLLRLFVRGQRSVFRSEAPLVD